MSDDTQLTDQQIAEFRKKIVTEARMFLSLGVKYQWGAEWFDLTKYPELCDCSEMLEGIVKKVGLKYPDLAQNQYNFTIGTVYPQDGDFGFFAEEKNITKVYHSGIYTVDGVIEMRKFDPKAKFPTGKCIIRPIEKWEKFEKFVGWRVHPKLVQIKAV